MLHNKNKMTNKKRSSSENQKETGNPISKAVNAVNELFSHKSNPLNKLQQVRRLEQDARERRNERNKNVQSYHISADNYLRVHIYPYIFSKVSSFPKDIPQMKDDGQKLDAQSARYYKLLIESDLTYKVLRPALFAGYKANSPYIFIPTPNGFKMDSDDPKLQSFEINFNDFDEKLNFKNDRNKNRFKELFNPVVNTDALSKIQEFDDVKDKGFMDEVIEGYESANNKVNVVESEASNSINVAEDSYINTGDYDPSKEVNIINNTKYKNSINKLNTSIDRIKFVGYNTPELEDITGLISPMLNTLQQKVKDQGTGGVTKEIWEDVESQFSTQIKGLKEFIKEHEQDIKDGKAKSAALMQFLTYIRLLEQ